MEAKRQALSVPAARRAFTLIELLVVIAMIGILMGALVAAVRHVMQQSKISAAETEVRELTHAILAYENAAKDHKLPTMDRAEATEDRIGFLVGKGTDTDGNALPVFYEAPFTDGAVVDPWGHPYRITIKEKSVTLKEKVSQLTTSTYIPNAYRLTADDEKVGEEAKK